MKKQPKLKTFSDSDICRNEVSHQEKKTAQWKKVIHCFYSNKLFPCSFITDKETKMENHHRQKHYFESKEVIHV